MLVFNISNAIILFIYLFLILTVSSSYSTPVESEERLPIFKLNSVQYKRLASHCYIHDYLTWLKRQEELLIWLQLAKLLKLPIQDTDVIRQELEQFRLQHECLRVMERLPLTIGPG